MGDVRQNARRARIRVVGLVDVPHRQRVAIRCVDPVGLERHVAAELSLQTRGGLVGIRCMSRRAEQRTGDAASPGQRQRLFECRQRTIERVRGKSGRPSLKMVMLTAIKSMRE